MDNENGEDIQKYKYILGTKETQGENTQKFQKWEAVL